MTNFFLWLFDRLYPRRKMVLAALTALVCLLAGLAATVSYEEDISKFLPSDHEHERNSAVFQRMNSANTIAILFSPADTTRQLAVDSLTAAMETFGQLAQNTDYLRQVRVTVDEERFWNMLRFVQQNIPYFLEEADYKRMDSLLSTPHFVEQQLRKNRQTLLLPMPGSMATETMAADPLHLFMPVLEKLQRFNRQKHFGVENGFLISNDGRQGLCTLESPFGPSETQGNRKLADSLEQIIEQTQRLHPQVKMSAVGAPLIAVGNAQRIKTDAMLAVSLAVVLIVVVLYVRYRRLKMMLAMAVSLLFGWLFALAGMKLLSGEVSVIVMGIGSVIIGIAVNYPLHFIDHMYEGASATAQPRLLRRNTLRDMVSPLLIGNITTVAAFLCLVWLDARAMRDLGLFGSLMLVGTIAFVLVALPLFVPVNTLPKNATSAETLQRACKTTLHNKLCVGRKHIPGWLFSKRLVLPVVCVLTLFFAWQARKTAFDSNLQHINYVTPEQQQGMEVLATMADAPSLYLVAEGNNTQQALQQSEQMAATLAQHGQAEALLPVNTFLKSTQAQHKALARWYAFWQTKHAHLAEQLQVEAKRQGFSSQAFAPFVALLNTRFKQQPYTFFAPLTQQLMPGLVQKADGKVRVVTPYYGKHAAQVRQWVRQHLPGKASFAFNTADIGNRLVSVLNHSLNYLGWVCGLVVFVFLWISFARIELSLLSFLPLAVSWVWILGMMECVDVQFNIVNIILATFIFGQGDDYTIFITEGLLYEHAYGRPRLAAYRRSVALSALLMFVGMGTLVVARHPALLSLAHVVLIGMFTVVLMAYVLPPAVFGFLTRKNKQLREVPLTLRRFLLSLWSIVFFACVMFLFFIPYTFLYFHLGKITERRRLKFHRMFWKMSCFVARHIPDVDFNTRFFTNEPVDKPAVLVCNHQSHLDIICLLTLHPKMVFVTNNWVWHNPFYGYVIRKAEFVPAMEGLETCLPKLKSLYERGYTICIFPEGTRSATGRVNRFHKGACYLAQQLGADILPVLLHGAGHVLPKTDFMLRPGSITMHVLPRLKPDDTTAGTDYRARTKYFNRFYKDKLAQMAQTLETAHYWAKYVQLQYVYRGREIERRCRHNLKRFDNYTEVVDNKAYVHCRSVVLEGVGQGECALLFALTHPRCAVHAVTYDADDYAIATHLGVQPDNLTWELGTVPGRQSMPLPIRDGMPAVQVL